MAIQIEKPEIKHKYISLFDTEAEFNAAYPNFEEVNWSDVAYPQERPDNYRVSRRLSNMYHKNTPPDYKFDDINDFVVEGDVTYYADGAYIGTFNEDDYTNGNIRKTFFLEIVWGYSGWEWHDYERVIGTDSETEEPITETLTGGNLYKIKNIQTVPHIIDGQRLQHINDFLFSQYNVTKVEGFNTSNLVAANRAFKRGTNDDTNYPKRNSNQILECHFVEGYNTDGTFGNHPFGYVDPVTGESLLENLVEADGLFFNNKVYMYEGDFENVIPFTIPNITHIDKLYSYGVLTNNLRFKMESLEELTDCFKLAIIPRAVVNLNDIFVDNTLNNIKNFSGFLAGASITEYTESGSDKITTIQLNLTNSNVDSNEIIDLSHFAEWIGPSEYGERRVGIIQNTILNILLNFDNKVNLSEGFANINRDKSNYPNYLSRAIYNNGFEKIHVNFNNKESYITSLKSAFANNTFIENLPVQQVPNNTCDDSYIYQSCTFNAPINYDFHNSTLASPRMQGWGQFNDCTFNSTFDFDPTHSSNKTLEYLDRVEFCGIKFGNNVPAADRTFPYVIQNQNDTTYRYFDMANSKFVGTLPAQNIYIDTIRLRNSVKYVDDLYGSRFNPFQGCSELTDLSNINLYYSDAIQEFEFVNFNFSGCTSIIKTPHIYLRYRGTNYVRSNLSFQGLKNLTDVNLENLSFRGGSPNVGSYQNFQDCTSLAYLKIATNTTDGFDANLNILGCTSLDVDTLKNTLMMIKSGIVQILDSTWKKVNGIDPTSSGDVDSGPIYDYFIAQRISCTVTKDNSYTPAYPD